MFLHWNVEHLFSNIVVLYYVGAIVARKLGPVPYTALYLLSGLTGNIFSIGYELFTNAYVNSVGASGAVFGWKVRCCFWPCHIMGNLSP